MQPVKLGVRRSREEWVKLIESQKEYVGSVVSFCKQHNISYKRFLYHRGRILKKENNCDAFLLKRAGKINTTISRSSFIPVSVEERANLRLRFPQGLVVESAALIPAAWIAAVAYELAGRN